jgi:hypothetical protein
MDLHEPEMVVMMSKSLFSKITSLLLFLISSSAFSHSASAATIDGKPSFNAGTAAAMYIWRDTANAFHFRLTGGSTSQNTKGGVSSSKSLNWWTATALEPNDGLAKTAANQLDFDLNVSPADILDGVEFGVPADASLCLWVSGSLGGKVFLGADKTPAASPIDLLGNGGCGSTPPPGTSTLATATTTPNAAGKLKYHPGHYIALNDWDSQADMIDAVKPGVRGIHKRYFWKDLEPTQGNYDFSAIASDLQIAADHGVQLIAMIVDKTFNGTKPTPGYLWGDKTIPAGAGWVAKRWDPYVISRLAALFQALGKRFDGNPNFEGIAIQETALGISAATKYASAYTPEKYRDALVQILRNARAALPTSQVFWYMNFLDGNTSYIGQIASAVVPARIAMGGPDILPDNVSLKQLTYPYYGQYHTKMTLFCSSQYDSYDALHRTPGYRTKYWTMPELYSFAKTNLYVNYIFWTRKVAPSPADSYDWMDALPVIKNNPGPFNPSPFGWQ